MYWIDNHEKRKNMVYIYVRIYEFTTENDFEKG